MVGSTMAVDHRTIRITQEQLGQEDGITEHEEKMTSGRAWQKRTNPRDIVQKECTAGSRGINELCGIDGA